MRQKSRDVTEKVPKSSSNTRPVAPRRLPTAFRLALGIHRSQPLTTGILPQAVMVLAGWVALG